MRLSAVTMMFMPEIKGEHIRSIAMQNLLVWIVLISTAALGVAVAQPNGEDLVAIRAADDAQRRA